MSFNFTAETATPEHLYKLQQLAMGQRGIEGLYLELGSFEGRSSMAICEAIFPSALICVDTWEGGLDGFGHDKTSYIRFIHNMSEADCLYTDIRMDMFEYLKEAKKEYTFIYLDASHDYPSVKKGIEMCLPLLVPGGLLCGDDFINAGLHREDLQGGVERAVREFIQADKLNIKDNMWWTVV